MDTNEYRKKLFKLQGEVTLAPHYKNYTDVVLPERFALYKEKIENFKVSNDDIWIASFPKSGNITRLYV